MSRSSYSDDYDTLYPNALNLFRANVDRAINGKRGQARLRELRDALLTLPTKALITDELEEDGQVCALGAWARQHQPDLLSKRREMDDDLATLLPAWPRILVLETIYENDEGGAWRNETPEQRYQRVLQWVEGHLV